MGDSASLERTLSTQDLRLFAALSGAAVADGAGAGAGAGTVAGADDDDTALIAHGMWGGMLLASVLGTRLPGPGTALVGQTLRFLAPLAAGDRLTVRVEVLAKQAEQRQVTLAVACTNQHGAAVIEGQATVHAPARHIERQRTSLPRSAWRPVDATACSACWPMWPACRPSAWPWSIPATRPASRPRWTRAAKA